MGVVDLMWAKGCFAASDYHENKQNVPHLAELRYLKRMISYLGEYRVDKEVKSKESYEYLTLAYFLSIPFAWYVKRALEDSFTNLQELSDPMDLGLFLVIFAPFHILFSKLAKWLYSYINNFNS